MSPIWPTHPPAEEPVEPNCPVPLTPLELGTPTPILGSDIADDFSKLRQQCDEGICKDAISFLRTGLSEIRVLEVIRLRRGADYGYSQEKAKAAISIAAELLAKQSLGKQSPEKQSENQSKKQSKSKREKL